MDLAELWTLPVGNDSAIDVGSYCAIVGKDDVNVVCQGEVNNCCRHLHYLLHPLH